MRKTMLIILGGLLALCCTAQERNAARLVLSDTTYVDVSLGASGQAGSLKDIYTPETWIQGKLDASARRIVGKVRTYGHFGYGYGFGTGSTWRGWINPYETPFMLADSIPGNLSLERYSLEAGAGLPLGRWSLGADVAYDVALMAKHRDLRNKNTEMVFRIAPGAYYNGGSFGAGLSLGYERGTERVEYTQVSSSVEHVLFDLYGLWLCHGSGYASAETRRQKENNRFFADLQLDAEIGPLEVHNNFRADYNTSVQTETGYNNLVFGDVRSLAWSDELEIGIGQAHSIEAEASLSTMQGFRPLQMQQLDPDSRIRVWVTYGDPVFCYYRKYHFEKVAYTYGTTWKLTAGVENWKMHHYYVEYPRIFQQKLGSVMPFVATEVPLGQWKVAANLGFAKAYDAYADITQWQLAEALQKQWDFWDGDNFIGGLSVVWHGKKLYVRADYGFEATSHFNAARHAGGLTLGLSF